MSKSAKAYGAAALVLIAFPLVLALWSMSSALMAVLLLGVGAYAAGVCFLIGSFWHRHRYGRWLIELEDDPAAPRPFRRDAGKKPVAVAGIRREDMRP